jgi:signal transduction histidine kinase
MSADLARLEAQRQQMTADIAHDLRTPLTVLGGYLEAMQDHVLEPTPERLATMQTEIQGLIRLVEDLRTLSLADAGALILQTEPVAPGTLLRRAAATFAQKAAAAGLEIRLQIDPKTPSVKVDPERFHQVLTNLLSNAIRHTSAGGTITLSAWPDMQTVYLQVEDTGEGIPPQDLPWIFDRFYRASRAREQNSGETGLGLAIVHSIITAHGATITATSDGSGKGSRFTIASQI